MKKHILFFIWGFLTFIYLSYQVDTQVFFFLRLNLWIQMIAVAFVLGATGSILQVILHNPIADPWLLGVSGASNLGIVLASLLMLSPLLLWRIAFSLLGAYSVILFLVLYIKNKSYFNVQYFILIGIGINTLCGSLIVFLQSLLTPNDFTSVFIRITGHFTVRDLEERLLLIPSVLLIIYYLLYRKKELQILSSGEILATTIGVDSKRIKYEGLIICSISLAFAISISGSIGFVGLATSHLIRNIFGTKYSLSLEYLFPMSGILILCAALLVKMMPNSIFIPIGSAMSLIGAPIFIYILMKNSNQ